MPNSRITSHPILETYRGEYIPFTWQGEPLAARPGERIASALFAHGIHVFGHHPKDGWPQGIYCANGQCSQCLVLADGKPVKACMTEVLPGMDVQPLEGLPALAEVDPSPPAIKGMVTLHVPALIIGGGPAGLAAALELGEAGVQVLLVDDKDRLGGKLVLQTHRFFGSVNAVYAGRRGIDIASILAERVSELPTVQVWLNSAALAVFSDRKVGILKEGREYVIVQPQVLVSACGAREKSLSFPGNTLPGVYGAGAFQTLANRDLVRPSRRLFIVGGGNVGLIAGYHALQAGIQVVGLAEALPSCGGYKVHHDKLARLGVPIYTSHTVLQAHGDGHVEGITIASVDGDFKPVAGTEKSFDCDTILLAVGLEPVDEFAGKARQYGLPVFSGGDAAEIAEASSAMFTGKIAGRQALRQLGLTDADVPEEWQRTAELLKSPPGRSVPEDIPMGRGVFPALHCTQEIPCNPCAAVCPHGLIEIDEEDIRELPRFLSERMGKVCTGCEKCVTVCPGLAITLVDTRKDPANPLVTVPFELDEDTFGLEPGQMVRVVDTLGQALGEGEVVRVKRPRSADRTRLVQLRVPAEIARQAAGIAVQESWVSEPLPDMYEQVTPDTILCRCERVTVGEVQELIRAGQADFNELKAITRVGMGACGGKTCTPLLYRLLQAEGVPLERVTPPVKRPLFMEVPLGILAGVEGGGHLETPQKDSLTRPLPTGEEVSNYEVGSHE